MAAVQTEDERRELENRATKLTLITLFFSVLGTFSFKIMRRREFQELRPFDLLLLGLTSYRVGRMMAFERVAQPLRAPFTETKPDDTGAGETVVATEKGSGAREAIGELLSCPICFGTWVAAGLVYGLHLLPRPTRVFVAVMGTPGMAEVVYHGAEALLWMGQAARRRCGD
jgi:hypothetical protein